MRDQIELLMNFGLSRQEAKIYYLLLTEGIMSGYEAAKRAGMSRSNVYGALAGLTEKGAACVLEEQSVRYQPVPIKEFCDNKLRAFADMARELEEHIPGFIPDSQNYITIHGRQNIEDKCRNMLTQAEFRVYFSLSSRLMPLYQEELSGLIREGKKVVLLTEEDYHLEGCIHYGQRHEDCRFHLITDSRYALTGEFQDQVHSTGLFSANPNLVKLLKTALANEIKLIRLKETGDGSLSPQLTDFPRISP
ncbi:MAG: TrmB family transcriptional regulator [Eubacterium sp.]|nr:TrmB family transcriptional regulator [Eubacterium sp.]